MADPDHIPVLDGFDRMTVVLYRLGIALAAVGLLTVAVLYGVRLALIFLPWWTGALAWAGVGAAVALSAANLHLYVKTVRWVLAGAAPLGLVLQVAALSMPDNWAGAWVLQVAGLGFVFVTLSGIALKERFCFRIPGLRLVPVLLAGGLVPVLIDWPAGVSVAYGLAGVVVAWLAVAKWTQPLGFDVGDKSRYQV